MSYPPKCDHGVIRCDKCPPPLVGAATRARLEKENEALRERVRNLEGQLTEIGDTNYDLKQQLRQSESLNEELRLVQIGRRK